MDSLHRILYSKKFWVFVLIVSYIQLIGRTVFRLYAPMPVHDWASQFLYWLPSVSKWIVLHFIAFAACVMTVRGKIEKHLFAFLIIYAGDLTKFFFSTWFQYMASDFVFMLTGFVWAFKYYKLDRK